MARNKLTHEWGEHDSIIITGSQRQPTLVEAINYLGSTSCEGTYIIGANVSGEWTPPEHVRSLTLYPYLDTCPVCAKTDMLTGPKCPVCLQKWPE